MRPATNSTRKQNLTTLKTNMGVRVRDHKGERERERENRRERTPIRTKLIRRKLIGKAQA